MQVEIAELAEHHVQKVRLLETEHLCPEVELVENLPRARRKAVDVIQQLVCDVGRVVPNGAQGQLGDVVEVDPGHSVQNRIEILGAVFVPGVLGEGPLLGRFEHAVEAAQDGEREDHPLVLGGPVVAPQEVRHLPNKGLVVLDLLGAGSHGR